MRNQGCLEFYDFRGCPFLQHRSTKHQRAVKTLLKGFLSLVTILLQILAVYLTRSLFLLKVSSLHYVRLQLLRSKLLPFPTEILWNYPYNLRWSGLFGPTIRLFTITLKRLILAYSNLVTFSSYLFGTFWQNFRKIHSSGGCCSCF